MWVLVFSGIGPLVLSFWPGLKFWQKWRALAGSIALILVIFGTWDVIATVRGHWVFHPQKVWNLRIINLPVEEVLFFVIIPFCCIFTWEVIHYFGKD